MECSFCNHIYKNSSSFGHHLRTNKKCIEIQLKKGHITESVSFNCSFCKKSLSTKQKLTEHIDCCKIKKKQDTYNIESKKEDKMEQISSDIKNQKEEMEYEFEL